MRAGDLRIVLWVETAYLTAAFRRSCASFIADSRECIGPRQSPGFPAGFDIELPQLCGGVPSSGACTRTSRQQSSPERLPPCSTCRFTSPWGMTPMFERDDHEKIARV